MLDLQALGIVGKLVTRPWMTRFYKNPGNLGHTDTRPYVQAAEAAIKLWIRNQTSILSLSENCFGLGVCPLYETFHALLEVDDILRPQLTVKVVMVLKGYLNVIQRQLVDELNIPITPQLRDKTKTVPANNIFGDYRQ